ncbi:hypothetical protein TNCV_2508501 [Trichonephila clavipes]|nr:hypothetical protein TNCV_2508501 [Trichonephila clavipes]
MAAVSKGSYFGQTHIYDRDMAAVSKGSYFGQTHIYDRDMAVVSKGSYFGQTHIYDRDRDGQGGERRCFMTPAVRVWLSEQTQKRQGNLSLRIKGELLRSGFGINLSERSSEIVRGRETHFWLNATSTNKTAAFGKANSSVCRNTVTARKTDCLRFYGLVELSVLLQKTMKATNVTVNGDRYRAMITNFFIPELNNHDVQELWFQQDGATCHTAVPQIDLLKDTLGDRLISVLDL